MKMNTWLRSTFTLAASAALSSAVAGTALAQGLPNFTTDTVTSEIDMPWGMTWLPNGDMLDIVLYPQYKSNGWIYISFSDPSGEGEGIKRLIPTN